MEKPLTESRAELLRKKELLADRHFAMREMHRIDFSKVIQILAEGKIIQEGGDKYRAVMPVKRGKIAFVIFRSHENYNELLTVGITTKK